MNIIEPTPSQAAVVLKNFFRRKSIAIDLGTAQEAVALTKGYASWNALASNEDPRGRAGKKNEPRGNAAPLAASQDELFAVTGRIHGDDDDSLLLIWAPTEVAARQRFGEQLRSDRGRDDDQVAHGDQSRVYVVEVKQVGSLRIDGFSLAKDNLPPALVVTPVSAPAEEEGGVLIVDIQALSKRVAGRKTAASKREDALGELKFALERHVADTGLFEGLRRMHGRDEMALEGSVPYIQLSYDIRLNGRFTTELVVNLRDHKLDVFVRTWESLDGLEPSSKYQIVDERSGHFDTNAERPDDVAPLRELLRSALKAAAGHKKLLQDRYNIV